MYLDTEKKQEIFEKFSFAKSKEDTGSAESQIALFTHRINHLTDHLRTHPQDYSSRLGLLKLVGKRRRLLDHLQEVAIERYRAVIAALNIRK
jgi:small subunit ribosomal protein S15